jgi:hypothetical protein
MRHRLAVPFVIARMAPNHGRSDNVVPVTVNIRPNFDALADDPFNRKTAAVNQWINIPDMESAAGTLDSLRCFVHGDAATDMEMTSRPREDIPILYTKPLTGHWFLGNGGEDGTLDTCYPLPKLGQFRDAPHLLRANRVPNEPFCPS